MLACREPTKEEGSKVNGHRAVPEWHVAKKGAEPGLLDRRAGKRASASAVVLALLLAAFIGAFGAGLFSGEQSAYAAPSGDGGDVMFALGIGGTSDDRFTSVARLPNGGFVAVGYASTALSGDGWSIGNNGGTDAILFVFDNDGNVVRAYNYGGALNDAFESVIVTSDYKALAVGHSSSQPNGNMWPYGNNGGADALIMFVTLDGTGGAYGGTYGGQGNERFTSVTETPDGYVAVGYSNSTFTVGDPTAGAVSTVLNNGDYDGIVFEFNHNGVLVRAEGIGGQYDDRFTSVAATDNGGYVIVGHSKSTFTVGGPTAGVISTIGNNGGTDAILLKYDAYRVFEGGRNYGGQGDDSFNSVTEISDGGIVTVGESNRAFTSDSCAIGNNGGYDAIAFKFGEEGVIEWAKNFGGAGDDKFLSVTEALSGGVAAAGFTSSVFMADEWQVMTNGGYDGMAVGISADGTVQGAKAVGGVSEDYFTSITEVVGGDLVAVGYSVSTFTVEGWTITNKGSYDAIAFKFYAGPPIPEETGGGGADSTTLLIVAAVGAALFVGAVAAAVFMKRKGAV